MYAIIGGSGLYQLAGFEVTRRQVVRTPYGEPSGALTYGRIGGGEELVFLARHGYGHTQAPHRINYRANLWALKHVGADRLISVATVGGVNPECGPGMLVVPDQIIDYTHGRANTYFDGGDLPIVHVDMTLPYSEPLRADLIAAAQAVTTSVRGEGVYGCTQGPRLETAAEIRRLARDGVDIVGMTGMPEAALARELDLHYAALCVVTNHSAGVGESRTEISLDQIRETLDRTMSSVHDVLGRMLGSQAG